MSDKIRIRITVETGFVGADHEDEIEVDRAKWEAMTEQQRDEFMEPEIETMISNNINGSYEVLGD